MICCNCENGGVGLPQQVTHLERWRWHPHLNINHCSGVYVPEEAASRCCKAPVEAEGGSKMQHGRADVTHAFRIEVYVDLNVLWVLGK